MLSNDVGTDHAVISNDFNNVNDSNSDTGANTKPIIYSYSYSIHFINAPSCNGKLIEFGPEDKRVKWVLTAEQSAIVQMHEINDFINYSKLSTDRYKHWTVRNRDELTGTINEVKACVNRKNKNIRNHKYVNILIFLGHCTEKVNYLLSDGIYSLNEILGDLSRHMLRRENGGLKSELRVILGMCNSDLIDGKFANPNCGMEVISLCNTSTHKTETEICHKFVNEQLVILGAKHLELRQHFDDKLKCMISEENSPELELHSKPLKQKVKAFFSLFWK
jgi:hypothetical protein